MIVYNMFEKIGMIFLFYFFVMLYVIDIFDVLVLCGLRNIVLCVWNF